MRYQIFIPGNQPNATLPGVGLPDHMQGADVLPCSMGPDGKAGRLYAWTSPTQTQAGYNPDLQTWVPSIAEGDRPSGAYYVGTWNAAMPTESDMRRPETVPGIWFSLGNGEAWKIPQPGEVPAFIRIGADRSFRLEPKPEFEWYDNEAGKRISELIVTDTTVSCPDFNIGDGLVWLAKVLAVNYRITLEVVDALKLIDTETAYNVYLRTLGIVGKPIEKVAE